MLAYECHGQGRPVYLLHGMSLERHNLLPVYEPLFQALPYRRYYLDLPGMGQTSGVGFNSSNQVLAAVANFIQTTADGQPALIFGHSYGGYLALGLLHEAVKLAGVFLTCPVVVASGEKRDPALHVAQPAPVDASAAYRDYLNANVVINAKTWQAYQQQIIPGAQGFDAQLWADIKARGDYTFSFEAQLPQLVQASLVPLRMLLGQQDNVVGYRDQLSLLGPKADAATVLPDAGHNLMIDQPRAHATAFNQFLQIITD